MLAFLILGTLVMLGALTVLAGVVGSAAWWVLLGVVGVLLLVGVYDVVQRRHSLLRNYPVLGHLRFLLEAIRPELQQYFIERNVDGRSAASRSSSPRARSPGSAACSPARRSPPRSPRRAVSRSARR